MLPPAFESYFDNDWEFRTATLGAEEFQVPRHPPPGTPTRMRNMAFVRVPIWFIIPPLDRLSHSPTNPVC